MYPHTLAGESAMFKMFACDPTVLGMDTMFEPKHRYLGDNDTYIDLESLHCFHMQMATRLLNACKNVERTYTGKSPFPKVETITKQVLLPIFCLDIMLFRKLMTVTMS